MNSIRQYNSNGNSQPFSLSYKLELNVPASTNYFTVHVTRHQLSVPSLTSNFTDRTSSSDLKVPATPCNPEVLFYLTACAPPHTHTHEHTSNAPSGKLTTSAPSHTAEVQSLQLLVQKYPQALSLEGHTEQTQKSTQNRTLHTSIGYKTWLSITTGYRQSSPSLRMRFSTQQGKAVK